MPISHNHRPAERAESTDVGAPTPMVPEAPQGELSFADPAATATAAAASLDAAARVARRIVPPPGVVTRDTPGVIWGEDGVPRSPKGVVYRTEDHRPRIVSLQVAPCYDEDNHVVAQFNEGPNEKTQYWAIYLRGIERGADGEEERLARWLCDVKLPDLDAARRFAERLAQDVADELNARLQVELQAARVNKPLTPEPTPIYVEGHRWERRSSRELRTKQPMLDHIDTLLPPGKAERFVQKAREAEQRAVDHSRVL